MIAADNASSGPNEGKNNVYAQITIPMLNPKAAPNLVAPRQKIPPRSEGKICATPIKEINPIAARADDPPESS